MISGLMARRTVSDINLTDISKRFRKPMTGIEPQPAGEKLSIGEFAHLMGINNDEADTLVREILPVLKRKYELGRQNSADDRSSENLVSDLLKQEIPNVFANYALKHLETHKQILFFLVKKIAPELTDLRVKQLVDLQRNASDKTLADHLAAHLGIRETHLKHFKSKVIPKLRKYTKAMYRKKLENQELIEDAEAYNDFIIENVFIDEFENHPYIRSVTDERNRAILRPEARSIAIEMILGWMREVAAENQ
jgi:hypothetical protein